MLVRGACCGTHCAPAALRSNNRSKSDHKGVCPAAHARPTPCASRHGQKGLVDFGPSLRSAWHARRAAPAPCGAERSDGPCGLQPPSGCACGAPFEQMRRVSLRKHARSDAHAHPASAPPQAQPEGGEKNTGHCCARPPRGAGAGRRACQAERSDGPLGWHPPFRMRRGAQRPADQGSRLSERRRREFERDPAGREHRRLPAAKRRDAACRVALSLLTFFRRSERK